MLPGLNFLTRSITIVLLTLPSLSLLQPTTAVVCSGYASVNGLNMTFKLTVTPPTSTVRFVLKAWRAMLHSTAISSAIATRLPTCERVGSGRLAGCLPVPQREVRLALAGA